MKTKTETERGRRGCIEEAEREDGRRRGKGGGEVGGKVGEGGGRWRGGEGRAGGKVKGDVEQNVGMETEPDTKQRL